MTGNINLELISNYLDKQCIVIFDKWDLLNYLKFEHIDQLKNVKENKNICLILDTGNFDINGAFECIEFCKEKNIKYDAIILNKLASAGTLLALNSEQLIFTKQGALGTIDPTHPQHNFPKFISVAEKYRYLRRINIDEINSYTAFVEKALQGDKKLIDEVLDPLTKNLTPDLLKRANEHLLVLKNKIKEILINHHPQCDPDKLSDFLITGAGSFDYTIHPTELKKLQLNFKLCPQDLETILNQLFLDLHFKEK
ncbi:hypothetical protein [Succinatimonas hippei]|uniref:hypothetical protein n=1 Tax=Succinatimonas hippei TaxID=626938 RepID=UPI002492ABF9|nr:hypothetical protein [Succinatimonas hippei]